MILLRSEGEKGKEEAEKAACSKSSKQIIMENVCDMIYTSPGLKLRTLGPLFWVLVKMLRTVVFHMLHQLNQKHSLRLVNFMS